MSAKELMKTPITINHDSNLADVTQKILKENIGRLLVQTNREISGIVTEKDLGMFLFTDKSERKLDEIPISEILKSLIAVDESSSISECAKMMVENRIGSVAMSSGGKIVGIITKTDLTNYFAQNHAGKKTVGEYMSPYYAWVYEDLPIYLVIGKMLAESISRVILRGHDESPVGILSFRDLLRVSLTLGQQKDVEDSIGKDISIVFPRKGFVSKESFGGTTLAKEIMKNEIITVNYDDDLAKACQVLIDNNINGAGVLSSKGTLVGILSKTDVIKAIAFMS